MKLYIGIDGGQTSIKCAIGNEEGTVLAIGTGGPATHLIDSESRRKVMQGIREAISEALRLLGLRAGTCVEASFLGFTGISEANSAATKTLSELFQEIIVGRTIAIDHDAQVALAGAIPSLRGIIAIAGTGSMAYGLNESGNRVRAGGWGYLLGDPGSAYEIGRQALAAVAREHDATGPPTDLSWRVMKSFSIHVPSAIRHVVYLDSTPKLRIAALAPVVSEAAQAGDCVAMDIMRIAGIGLGQLVCAVARILGMMDKKFKFSTTGGVFKSGDPLGIPFKDEVLSCFPLAEMVAPRFSPHIGAYLMALRLGGVSVDEELLCRVEQSLRY